MDDSNSKIYIDKDGGKIYKNLKGQVHRLDGPAVERKNGDKIWCKEGLLHRLDGPTCDYSNGNKYWYKEGLYHRVDGPACEYVDGDKIWYILNKSLEEKDFNSWILRIKILL